MAGPPTLVGDALARLLDLNRERATAER